MGFKDSEIERYSVEEGDLMVCEGGEPGRCAVLRGFDGRLMYQKALHRVRPHGGFLSNEFTQVCLEHYVAAGKVVPRASETTIKHLPLEKMQELRIPVPPLGEQLRIAEQVQDDLSLADECAAHIRADLLRCRRLRQAILKWAFEGKLVDQDPEDEPAQVLLEQIQSGTGAAR
jgi:type I restriction enzyme S subunit